MARNRRKHKGRRDGGTFVALPHAVLESETYARLGNAAVRLLIDLYGQYRGSNNGDLSLEWRKMERRGWRSKDTLHRAKQELLENGMILLTRQGGKHQCSLFAVTWQPVDDCGGKLDVLQSNSAPGYWRYGRPPLT